MTFDYCGEAPRHRGSERLAGRWNTFFACRNCGRCVVFDLFRGPDCARKRPSECHGNPFHEGFLPRAVYPEPQQLEAPEHVPDQIAADYIEAADNLRALRWTSAGMMSRRVLTQATARLAPDGVSFRGTSLYDRINTLAEHQLITPAMREWAHAIRLGGNEAAHPDELEGREFSPDEADDLKEFTELFLIYAFTLPERVRMNRERRERSD